MDLATLTDRIRTGRRLPLQAPALPHVTFSAALPTRHAWRLELMQQMSPGVSVAAASVAAERAMLARALVGWTDLRLRDIDPALAPDDDSPLDHSPEAVALLLDERPDVAAQLAEHITNAMRARDDRFQAAEKNSGSASPINETGAKRSN